MEVENCWLSDFDHGNYKNCRILLEKELNGKSSSAAASQTQNFIVMNNIAVCSTMELTNMGNRANFEEMKQRFGSLLRHARTLPGINTDLNLILIYNFLYIHWISQDSSDAVNEFEEQLSSVLPNIICVLDCGARDKSEERTRLEHIKMAFGLGLKSFEYLDQRQAILVNAIRTLIAVAAQTSFVQQITLLSHENINIPTSLLRPEVDRSSQQLLLLPLLEGPPCSLAALEPRRASASCAILLAALLARVGRTKAAATGLPENHEHLQIRALILYMRAWRLWTCDRQRIESQRHLEVVLSMREGREGMLGCWARVLQAKLVAQTGKQQQAVNILRQAAKVHGSRWQLLQPLIEFYKIMNQTDAHIKSLELFLESLLGEEEAPRLLSFPDRVLQCLHATQVPSASSVLYQLANLHLGNKAYEAGSERLLQVLSRREELAGLAEEGVPGVRQLVRETSLALLMANRLPEAGAVIQRATTCPPPREGGQDWLSRLPQDLEAFMLAAKIQISSKEFSAAIHSIDICVSLLSGVRVGAADATLHSRLLARCHTLRAEASAAEGDAANTKHSLNKALAAHKENRETLLQYENYLLQQGSGEAEIQQLWWSHEAVCKKFPEEEEAVNHPVLAFLLGPALDLDQRKKIEDQLKNYLLKKKILNHRKC